VGVKYKNPTKLVGKRFDKLNRIYLTAQKFEKSGYEFVRSKSKKASALKAEKKIVRKVFPQSIPDRVKGVWVPHRVAGSKPRIKFDLDAGGFSVGAKGIPVTEFVPVERDDMIDVLSDNETVQDAAISRMLAAFDDVEQITPVSDNGGSFDTIYTGDKGFQRQQIKDWIQTYGWSATPKQADARGETGAHDMAYWFAGFSAIREGDK
jgi:hypothetical protein